jgi:hypothetical protein
MLSVLGVEMRLTVVVKVHRNHNPVEAADLWHDASVPSCDARVVRTR